MSTNPAEAYAEKLKRECEANPITINYLDEDVIAKLPEGIKILRVVPSGASAWCKTFRIDAKLENGDLQSYFMKYEAGESGQHNVPKPTGFGEFKDEPGTWFYVCEFHDMLNQVPEVYELVAIVAKVHRASMGNSPTGKFGFDTTTHLANIPNDNAWQDTWEAFFMKLMKSIYEHETLTQGEDKELDSLLDALCKNVIPRLLRPLESGGRSIKP
ncbi:hypothetical protein yc1106_08589 [Curvularia clavata]|uniref:protein-ribulosamine 3-kinase n=1 Tax=Curvularia clavata TaxID=95742 RepID=A0A9Q8ZFK6_CURCL|nr:hypothetical protein yc1106_08589 [Curvularia clavata]